MSAYSPLFSVDVEHVFWTQPTVGLTCAPTPETADWIRRRGLLVRPQRNGIAVFCEATRRTLLLDGLEPGAALLAFKWSAQDPLFSQYTLPVMQGKETLLYLRSDESVLDDDGRRRLHSGDHVDLLSAQPMTAPSLARHIDRRDTLRNPVLVAEIDLADHVTGQAAGVDYYARFSVRKSLWKYYFVSDAEPADVIVVDLDETVRFAAGEPEQLPGNRRSLVFVSDREIEMQQRHAQRFQLREQGKMGERVLIRRLPNADVSKVTQEMVGSSTVLISEIYIN
jgi:hypothetical protein